MTKTYIDSRGHCHHIASFDGKHNRLKSLVLLAVKTEPEHHSLSARQIEELTGLGFNSMLVSISKWHHWYSHYLNRKGKRRLYRYNLATSGAEFLEILHRVRPDKEEEYLNIITTNREKRESERINIVPKEKKPLSPKEDEEEDVLLKQITDDIKSRSRIVIPKEKSLPPEEDGPAEDADKKTREELLSRFKARANPKNMDKTNGQNS
jgi:hypothetical protein